MQDQLGYIGVQYSGLNTVLAFVAWPGEKTYKSFEWYLVRSQDEVLDVDGEGALLLSPRMSAWELGPKGNLVWAEVEVDVPKEAFAPPPKQWDLDWVSWHYNSEFRDQCDYRRRRLYAYTLQPIVFALVYLTRLGILTIMLFFGFAPSHWKFLYKPLTFGIGDVDDVSSFLRVKRWEPSKWAHLPKVFTPALWLIGYLFYLVRPQVFLAVGYILANLLLVGILGVGIYFLVQRWWPKSTTNPEVQHWEDLVCAQTPRKSIKLVYQGIKAAVCLPYSKR